LNFELQQVKKNDVELSVVEIEVTLVVEASDVVET
jgi:hypothetical protein